MINITATLLISLLEAGMVGVSSAEQPTLVGSAVNVFGSLIIVLAILVVGLYWSKRYLKTDQVGSKVNTIRVLGSTHLGVKKSISLVEIPGSILVLGLSNDSITLLSTIEHDDMEEIINANAQKENEAIRPAWINRFRVFSPSAGAYEAKMTPAPVFSFVKGKILNFKKSGQMRLRPVRIHPVPVGKDDYE